MLGISLRVSPAI